MLYTDVIKSMHDDMLEFVQNADRFDDNLRGDLARMLFDTLRAGEVTERFMAFPGGARLIMVMLAAIKLSELTPAQPPTEELN